MAWIQHQQRRDVKDVPNTQKRGKGEDEQLNWASGNGELLSWPWRSPPLASSSSVLCLSIAIQKKSLFLSVCLYLCHSRLFSCCFFFLGSLGPNFLSSGVPCLFNFFFGSRSSGSPVYLTRFHLFCFFFLEERNVGGQMYLSAPFRVLNGSDHSGAIKQ